MKKTVAVSVFVLVLGLAAVLNFVVFPNILSAAPESGKIKSVPNESVNIEKTNELLNNVISEKKAIQIALDKANDLPGVCRFPDKARGLYRPNARRNYTRYD